MSLCDKCFSPGACCKDIGLSREGQAPTFWKDSLEKDVKKFLQDEDLPFELQGVTEEFKDEQGDAYVTANFSCPKLGDDGRCTIYENRPDTCRNYEPASDRLCVHFEGAEGFCD